MNPNLRKQKKKRKGVVGRINKQKHHHRKAIKKRISKWGKKKKKKKKREVNKDTKDHPCRSTNDHRPLGLFSILYGLTPKSIPKIQLNRSDNFYIRPEPIHPTHSRPQPRRSPGGDKGNPSGVTSTLTIFSQFCFQIYTLCTRQRFRRFALARRFGVTVTQSSIACI